MGKGAGEHSTRRKQHSWEWLEPMGPDGRPEGLEGSGGPKVTVQRMWSL